MFESFESRTIDVGETHIFARIGGNPSRQPLLLLHGFPETHVMWHKVAPQLVRDGFFVVCADLRGYGSSGKPPSSPNHTPYAKRALAQDMVTLMQQLDHERFAVAGHDRGGRVAYRMALDHPERVARLAVLDVVPTSEVFTQADQRLALGFWPWSLLAQAYPLPERLLAGAAEAVIDDALTAWSVNDEAGVYPDEVRRAYIEALSDPDSVHAVCEEYRAAATLDVKHDQADYDAGKKIVCPVLTLWGATGALGTWYTDAGGPLGIWRRWAEDVRGQALECGHFMPEEQPDETHLALREFLAD